MIPIAMNNLDQFLAKIAAGQICFGSGITFGDASVSELLAEVGYDFVWIDLEHSALSLESALNHVMVLRGSGTAPFIRVPWNDPVLLKPVLELAPAAVIIPMVRTAEEAAAAVSACKYPPAGVRGFGPRRGVRFGAISTSEYLAGADVQTLVMLQVEHVDALPNLPGILAVAGVDGVCVGPNDLSGSMGKLGRLDDPDVRAAIVRVLRTTREANKLAGIACGFDPATVKLWIESGAQWINLGGDWINLFAQSRTVLQAARGL
jgi:2-dehydro-3-deoxyglucarate aldolase/4-hydroxy-2-oxoheptanedioate aldolase